MTAKVSKVAEAIYRLEVKLPREVSVFTVYFIEGGGNTIIEPGPAALIPDIQQAAAELSLTEFRYIIPTHIHQDHAGATGGLSAIYPGAEVVANAQGAKHIIDPSRLIRSTKLAFGDNFEEVYGAILPVPEQRIRIIEDEERLYLNGRDLIIIHTPGHAPHHIAIFDTETGGLFCGEALGLIYVSDSQPLPAAAPPSFDLDIYIESMEKLGKLPSKFLIYSHGGMGWEPQKLISSAIENTKIIGNVILQARQTNQQEEAVIQSVGSYIEKHFGVKLKEYDLVSNINGYTGYYKKIGLI